MPFKKSKWIWMNGKLVKWEDAKIHILSHVVHYGSGVFEGIRAYYVEGRGPAIFRLEEHIDRLFESARVYMMEIPFTKEQIMEACKEVVRENNLRECYIRPLVYRGYYEKGDEWGALGLNPLKCPVHVAIAAFEWPSYGAPTLKAVTTGWTRITPTTLPPLAKACGQYLNSQLAHLEAAFINELAEKAGLIPKDENGNPLVSYEAIMLDHRGFVSEGPGENIFIVKNEVLYTPPVYASILKGVTRATVMEIAKDLGFEVVERDISRVELYTADEVFMCGTAAEIKPVVEIDFRPVGDGKPGKITMKLKEKFDAIVHGKDKKYIKWLTFVE